MRAGPGLEARGVHPPEGDRVAQEVLTGGHHALAQVLPLQAADVGDAQRRAEVGVLAEGLVHPPPPRVESHVQDG